MTPSRLLAVALLLAAACRPDGVATNQRSVGSGRTGYEVVHGWPVLPAGRILGQATGVGVPHGLSIDDDDNVWVTDVGRHRVFKFTHDADLLLSLGTDRVPGAESTHFNRPTDVAVSPDGGFHVSDGYENTRVARFSPTGEFLDQWGTKGAGPGRCRLGHDIAVGRDGAVYVVYAWGMRVQKFVAR